MKRNKIDLDKPLLNVAGESVAVSPSDARPMTLAMVMQDGLGKTQSDIPVKVWTWINDLIKSPSLTLDQPDKAKLYDLVTRFQIFDFAKAQLLLSIENAEEC